MRQARNGAGSLIISRHILLLGCLKYLSVGAFGTIASLDTCATLLRQAGATVHFGVRSSGGIFRQQFTKRRLLRGPANFLIQIEPVSAFIYCFVCESQTARGASKSSQGWHRGGTKRTSVGTFFVCSCLCLPALNPNGIVADFRAKVKRAESYEPHQATRSAAAAS